MEPKRIRAIVFVVLILLGSLISVLIMGRNSEEKYLETYTYVDETETQAELASDTKDVNFQETLTFIEEESITEKIHSEEISSERIDKE